MRVSADPGPLSLVYDATVEVRPYVPPDAPTREAPFAELPVEVLAFLHPAATASPTCSAASPSRHSAHSTPGFERVTGICNWI